jgi:hypothetical protein
MLICPFDSAGGATFAARSTQSVENPVETGRGAPRKLNAINLLKRFALCDSSVTGARDLRGGRPQLPAL